MARENGAGPIGQIAFGLAGGLSPTAITGAGAGLSSLASRALGAPGAEVSALARRALDAGIPLKTSQVSPSKIGKLADSVTASVPFSGSRAFDATQQQAFNRAVGKTIGVDSPTIDAPTFAKAKQAIGASYDDLASRINTKITPDVQAKLNDVLHEAQQFGADDSAKAISNALQRVKDQAAGGELPGKAFKSLDSQLGTIAKQGGEKGNYAAKLRQVLRDAFTASAGPEDRAQMQLANKQYANLKTIEPLVAKDSVDGNIAPGQLLGRVNANGAGKAAMASGRRGELGDLANIGSKFLRNPTPDSGTSQRLMAYKALGSLGTLGAGAVGGSVIGVPATLASLATAVGGARGIQALLRNPAMVKAMLGDGG